MKTNTNYDNFHKINIDHVGHMMMKATFKSKKIKEGVRNALFALKIFTQSEDVLLYRKDNKTGNYDLYLNALMLKNNRKNNVDWLHIFINKSKSLFEGKEARNVDCSDISCDHNITLFPLLSISHRYLLVIRNCNIYDIHENDQFIDMINDDMSIILDKLEDYNKAKKEANKDRLTGLDNRNAFDNDVKELLKDNERFTYVLFDLLGLKTINDNYDHILGDAYIAKSSDLLKKYFSKWYTIKDTAGIPTKVPTGSCVYRTGGDEFVLISKHESPDLIRAKLKELEKEVANIQLNVSEKLFLGINYGLAVKNMSSSIQEVYKLAEDEMHEHKKTMYEKYGVERRRQFVKTKEE